MRQSAAFIVITGLAAALISCGSPHNATERIQFTEIDSLTDSFLMLEDSMLTSWNEIMRDENEKIKSMRNLVHQLMESRHHDKVQLAALESRVDKLEQMKFTTKSMTDLTVVDEYDFASNSLVTEIISLAEADVDFPKNKTMQEEVDKIKIADQHIAIYRIDYDSAASHFNLFLERNKKALVDLDPGLSQEKRTLF